MFDIVFKLMAEMLGETAYREYRRISQCTNGATCHIVTNRIKQL